MPVDQAVDASDLRLVPVKDYLRLQAILRGVVVVHYLFRLLAQLLEVPLRAAALRQQLVGGVESPALVLDGDAWAEHALCACPALLAIRDLLCIHALYKVEGMSAFTAPVFVYGQPVHLQGYIIASA